MEIKPHIIRNLSDRIVELGLFMIVAGLFISNALKSIGLATVSLSILLHPKTVSTFKRLLNTRLYWVLIVLAAGYLLSFINSHDLGAYWKLSRIKWAYLAFPVAVVNCSWSKHGLRLLFITALSLGVFQACYSLYHYLDKNSMEIAGTYATGNFLETFKTGTHQVSILFSVLILLIYDRIIRQVPEPRYIRLFLAGAGILFFIMVHVYAVRTGIVFTYFFMIGYTVYAFRGQFKKLIFILTLTASLGLVLLLTMDTVKHRVAYLKYDIEQYVNKRSGAFLYSDSRRLASIHIGLEVIERYPWFGCGLGDLNAVCTALYQADYPETSAAFYYLPHSQYIFILAAFGLLIGLPMCISLFYPGFLFFQRQLPVFFLLGAGWVVFALWDTPLATLFGNCLFLVFISFGLRKILP